MSEFLMQVLALAVALPVLIIFLSIDAVEQNEYGLMYNWVTKRLGTEVYHGGTHFVGFWNKFIVFPATVQTIEFSDRPRFSHAPLLHTRTKEGLGLFLAISFQYKLDPNHLSDLFALTTTNYEGLYRRIARDQLLEAASDYEGPQYWLERRRIGDHMRNLVDEQLKQSYASLWDFQLQVIDLPDKYEGTITKTEVQRQIIKTRRNEQLAKSIRADTEVLRAEFARQIQIVQADATANYTLQTKVAEAEASQRKIAAEAETLGYIRSKLGLSPEEAVRYEQLGSFHDLDNATFVAGLPNGMETGVAAAAAAAVLPASHVAVRAHPAAPEQEHLSPPDAALLQEAASSSASRPPGLRAGRRVEPSPRQSLGVFGASAGSA
mmetsp:Transcript_75962/g.220609  ORF Transcript_75962/g.220609 Transcript_75962/m.220609 type:complete len:378 (-) Transcript_75962:86-1219(-)